MLENPNWCIYIYISNLWNERAMWCLENGRSQESTFPPKIAPATQSPSLHPANAWSTASLSSCNLTVWRSSAKESSCAKTVSFQLSFCCIQRTIPLFCRNKFISTCTHQFRHILDTLTQGNFKVLAFLISPCFLARFKQNAASHSISQWGWHRTTWNMVRVIVRHPSHHVLHQLALQGHPWRECHENERMCCSTAHVIGSQQIWISDNVHHWTLSLQHVRFSLQMERNILDKDSRQRSKSNKPILRV